MATSNTSAAVATPMQLPLPKRIEPELEPDMHGTSDIEMPGTPPIAPAAAAKAWAANDAAAIATRAATETATLAAYYASEPLERMAPRHAAAIVLQRASRSFVARRALAHRLSAVGRPVELRITTIQNLELLCDFRDVASVFCNVRVLKRPFGPFMFEFSTSKSSNVHLPTWTDAFFVPMLSSRCDVVVTLVGVTVTNKQRFLGQAIAQLEPGWERQSLLSAPLGKWKFPVELSLLGLHRFVSGSVQLALTPVSSRLSCKAGQFRMAPPIVASTHNRRSRFAFWSSSQTRQSLTSLLTPSPLTPRLQHPLSASASPATAMRQGVVTRWGVLTDTAFHLFDHSSAKLLLTIELAKLQLIQSSRSAGSGNRDERKSAPSRLFPVKIYASGTLYTLFVSTYAQQQAWEYKIDLHRRQLLIP